MDRHVPLTIFIPWTHYCMMERQQLFKMEQNKKYDKSPYHLLAKRTDKAGVGGEDTDTYIEVPTLRAYLKILFKLLPAQHKGLTLAVTDLHELWAVKDELRLWQ